MCVCEHEATEHAASSGEFWRRAEEVAGQARVYGNADSALLYVLPALLAARPLTKVVWIERPMAEVAGSMRRAGFKFCQEQATQLAGLRRACEPYFDVLIPYRALERIEHIRWLWKYLLADAPFDEKRWENFKHRRIAYTAASLPPKRVDKFMRFIVNEGLPELKGGLKESRTDQ